MSVTPAPLASLPRPLVELLCMLRLRPRMRRMRVCGMCVAMPGARRSGGVLTLVLACGTVCHVSACAGFESATQIFGLLAEVRSKRSFTYVVYDNACMLTRFVRNSRRMRRAPPEMIRHIQSLVYVLDRFHERGHRACSDPAHRLYNPSVRMDFHEQLRGLNSSQNEQWNGWAGKFAHIIALLACTST